MKRTTVVRNQFVLDPAAIYSAMFYHRQLKEVL